MSVFAERDGELAAEGVPLADIAARFGTPCFVYSRAAIESAYRASVRVSTSSRAANSRVSSPPAAIPARWCFPALARPTSR